MDFTFNEEQTLIQDQVDQFIQKEYDWETRQSLSNSDLGFGDNNWQKFAELGWLGISTSEECGGFGGSAIESMLIMEAFGKGLVVEPFLETIIMCGGLIDEHGTDQQKSSILESAIEGKMHLAMAYAEPQSRFNLSDVVTEAKEDGDSFVLNGYKSVVMNGPSANKLIVSARTSGAQLDENGITLFLIDGDAEGLNKTNYKTVDGRRASDLTIENVKVTKDNIIGQINDGFTLLDSSIDRAILAISAEAVGAMEVLYKTTVEYTKTREQFGTSIGKFQVLQHRMVDMFMEYEQCKSLLYMATMKQEEGSIDSKKAISGLKYQVGKAGKFIGQQAVQLHGGMGVTDELNVGHYFKRLTTIGTIFGNTDYHLKKYSSL
ncbi:acyl-CoA dehydrogenase family protein [Gammaproteobacteria bacterium]|nr:acyl-CoA dehydrogenase family protein [Gammaproteobacteria bacterium]MDC0590720.1 acyl-CoA dehydrogenase family protein [Gammaproteobacteria bacterium]MDC1251258.1 acyl-CoA dehydrogenase family protein [Gammaproteobacteria bacterium]